jgi:hypothetical protein
MRIDDLGSDVIEIDYQNEIPEPACNSLVLGPRCHIAVNRTPANMGDVIRRIAPGSNATRKSFLTSCGVAGDAAEEKRRHETTRKLRFRICMDSKRISIPGTAIGRQSVRRRRRTGTGVSRRFSGSCAAAVGFDRWGEKCGCRMCWWGRCVRASGVRAAGVRAGRLPGWRRVASRGGGRGSLRTPRGGARRRFWAPRFRVGLYRPGFRRW